MIPFNDRPDDRQRRTPYVTYSLIALNVLIFLFEISLGDQVEDFIRTFGVTPLEITTGVDVPPGLPMSPYITLITSQFIHFGILHIVGNMLFLWVFGDNVEDAVGHIPFLIFYLFVGVVAGLTQVLINPLSTVPGIGASGAIAGVLAAYLLLYPHAPVRTLLLVVPFVTVTWISALFLIGFWFVLQLFNGFLSIGGVEAQTGGVAFFAHIGGFLIGAIIVAIFRTLRGGPVIGENR